MIDLHIHSTASDGSLAPEKIVRLALKKGLTAIAIADHDSVEGCAPAIAAAHDTGLTIVPAVEMSSEFEGRDLHLLGYFVDLDDQQFIDFLREMRQLRVERVGESLARLRKIGVDVRGLDRLLQENPDRSIGRGLIARLLIEEGYARDMREAFFKYLAADAPGHVDKGLPGPEEIIAKLRSHGAVAVLAHPGVARIDHAIEDLVSAGLRGLEAYHPDHDTVQVRKYLDMADDFGIAATGGSDCHGATSDRGVTLGTLKIPDHLVGGLRSMVGAG